MDAERALISKIVHGQLVEKIVSEGIDETHFMDPECREVFQYSVEHTRKWGTPPSFDVIRDKFKDVQFDIVSDSTDFVLSEFRKSVKRRAAIEGIRQLANAVDDPDQLVNIEEHFLEASRSLSNVIPTGDVAKFSNMRSRLDMWKERKKTGVTPGIAMGITPFDNLTLGIQPHEYVSIVGWQGTGKSTLTQYVLFNAYLQGRDCMMVSLEMEADALYRKWDVMATNHQKKAEEAILYHDIKAHSLDDKGLKAWEKQAELAANAKNDIIVIDEGKITVDRVYAEAVRYKPHIIAVDYVTLMETPSKVGGSMWESVTYLTKNLKAIARQLKVPIIGVAQTNINSADEGAELKNISYSRSIGQDSDLVFGLHQDEQMYKNKQMAVRMLKNRDGQRCEVEMLWDPGKMQFREWNAADMFNRTHEQNGKEGN